MGDTPRTDAVAYDDDGRTYLEHAIDGRCVSADFARTLERDNAALRAVLHRWHCIPATYAGARHIRDRVWIIAYASSLGLEGPILTRNSIEASGVAWDWSAPARTNDQVDWQGWQAESPFLGSDDDASYWMDRINALGNATVPQIPEIIGRAIMEAERAAVR